MFRSRSTAAAQLSVIALIMAAPVYAQSVPALPALGQASQGHHIHEGEIGERLLEIEHDLRCNCSCGLDTHSCQFQMQCGVSPGWTARILASLEAGDTKEAIEASFVAEFGGTVLMSPPAEGFNLVGYFLPSVAIVMAGMLIGLLVRGGAGRSGTAPVRELGEEDAEKLREALRRLDEDEGPDW
jgi:cytochrome c-type biogenesis protein CcmH/NrfF